MIFKRVINGFAISRLSSSRWIIMMLGSFSWNWNSYCPAIELGHWIKIGLSENSIPMLTPFHPLVYWQNLGCNPKLLLEIKRNHPSLWFSIRYILVNHLLYSYLNYTRLCLKMVLSPRWSLKMIISEMFCPLFPQFDKIQMLKISDLPTAAPLWSIAKRALHVHLFSHRRLDAGANH